MNKRTIVIGCLCALGAETIYGLGYVVTKQVTDYAGVFTFLGWRFLVAAIIMTIAVLIGIIKVDIRKKPIHYIVLVAISSNFYLIAETIGIRATTACESGTFIACIPVTSLIASSLMLGKSPTRNQTVGILVTLTGVVITVIAVGISASFSIIGYTFLLMAVCSYAIYCVFVEKAGNFSSVEITYFMLVSGAVIFVTIAIVESLAKGSFCELATLPFTNTAFLLTILFHGVGSSIVAFLLSNMAIAKIGVNRTASFIGVSTVVAIFSGAIFLNESFTLYQGVGAAIIVLGVYIANFKLNIK